MKKILIVEDEAIIRTALRKLLERHGFVVSEAASVSEVTAKYRVDDYDLIISDLRLPGEPGTNLITTTTDTPVLIMTSYASLRSAVDSMRMGAADYISKPFDHDEMIATVRRILSEKSAGDQETGIKVAADQERSSSGMLGDSTVMQNLYKRIAQVAPTDATILIIGETGTGKELTARAIHKTSQRADKPLISINCAAIPDTLIESELFGHEKGAFTGAASRREGLVVAADGGTLFLDEIGELPMEAQARLLRVLQEGEVRPVGSVETRRVDIRLIAATHRDLDQCCQQGAFREDLYFRLNVIQVQIPPLRQRGNDIAILAESMIQRFCETYQKPTLKLSPEAVQLITHYHWPGNVRELENAIQRAVILCEHRNSIDKGLLALEMNATRVKSDSDMEARLNIHNVDNSNDPAFAPNTKNMAGIREDDSLTNYFQRFVLENQGSMNETELAKRLGVSRKCLWERRQKLGIPRKKQAQRRQTTPKSDE